MEISEQIKILHRVKADLKKDEIRLGGVAAIESGDQAEGVFEAIKTLEAARELKIALKLFK